MNDSGNNSKHSQVSAEETDIELKINRRSLSVYEQYLKKTTQGLARVQQSDDVSDHSTDNLSDDEKDFFSNFPNNLPDSSSHTNSTATAQEKTAEKNKVVAVNHINSVSFRAPTEVPDSRLANHSRLISVVAVFCALLLVAVTVIAFNANNNLMALTDRLSSVNNQMSAVNDNISVIGQENSLANAKAVAEERAADAKNAASLALVKQSIDSIALNTKPVKTQPVATRTTRVRSMRVGDVNIEPTISYDDFKNESQVTVYREATN